MKECTKDGLDRLDGFSGILSSIYRTRSYTKLEHQKKNGESASNRAGLAGSHQFPSTNLHKLLNTKIQRTLALFILLLALSQFPLARPSAAAYGHGSFQLHNVWNIRA